MSQAAFSGSKEQNLKLVGQRYVGLDDRPDGRGRHGVVQQRLQESDALGLRCREALLEPIAHGHQFVDLGDDPPLFSKGRGAEARPIAPD